jgi:ubiquinone/menaquinone biosynthesis C-methylase UbiE
MEVPNDLTEVLAEKREARLIEESIYSVIPQTPLKHHYDRRSAVYDALVGTRLYHAIMWGSSPRAYTDFASEAVGSGAGERFLDAGCGSMLFTAPAYLESTRPIVAFDQSLAMLRRARQRLIELGGSVPKHILLLQADLTDLPFRAGLFRTVLFMNVLHQFEDAPALIPKLRELLTAGGELYLTSLVSNKRFIGDGYLRVLYATGEFVRPRSKLELKLILKEALGEDIRYRTEGNMAFATAKATSRGAASP